MPIAAHNSPGEGIFLLFIIETTGYMNDAGRRPGGANLYRLRRRKPFSRASTDKNSECAGKVLPLNEKSMRIGIP